MKQNPPMKPRVEGAIKGLNQPISKLGHTSNQLLEKEQKLFNKIVQAKQNGDIRTAKVLATELFQIKKRNQ
ncbi:MAG: hypothetical protein ACRBB5_07840 [Nitrosopumilus sp.]